MERVSISFPPQMLNFLEFVKNKTGQEYGEIVRGFVRDKMIAEKFNTVMETPPPTRREKSEKQYAEVPEPDDPREPTFLRIPQKDSDKIPEIAPWVSFIVPVKGGFHLWKDLSYYEAWQKENPYGEC